MQTRHAVFLLLGGALLLPRGAIADGASGSLAVNATVTDTCSITSSNPALDFGTYNSIANASVNLDGSTNIAIKCTAASMPGVVIMLGQGANPDAGSTDDAPLRRMKMGTTDFLSYTLFQNAGRSTVWGNTVGAARPLTTNGNTQVVTIYARIPSGQVIPYGVYSDTVQIAVQF
jgi:spore coat protein U domain-containing protein, fimbrial subunit CupE1/2/3/6